MSKGGRHEHVVERVIDPARGAQTHYVPIAFERRLAIGLVDLAAREDERARDEIDLVMALDHEDFDCVRRIAHQKDRRGRK